jgi:hypothetical protein
MAYDFGSQSLGIKNPFKFDGTIKTLAGILICLLALIPLLHVSGALQTSKILGWGNAIAGLILLVSGVRHIAQGLFQLFRFFVGRSVPTSLALNLSSSEREAAKLEQHAVLYDDAGLHSMLMGRKNTTFKEPLGWLARLIHSVFPKLTFLPYPFRHLAQELASMAVNVLAALVAYIIAYFVVATGLAGKMAQELAMPVLSVCLLFYLLLAWRSATAAMRSNTHSLQSEKGISFAVLMGAAIILPVIAGLYLDEWLDLSASQLASVSKVIDIFGAWTNLGILLVVMAVIVFTTLPLLIKRMQKVTPQTEVSEFRENLQESVHPDELFINIENIVLANRRVREVPNRIYRALEPKLKEQVDGKGSFNGEFIIETQPELADESFSTPVALKKTLSLVSQAAVVLGAVLFYFFAHQLVDFIIQYSALPKGFSMASFEGVTDKLSTVITLFFAWVTVAIGANVMQLAARYFWGEIHFSSLLMFMKAEGTFTESKFSTGMSIHDSTRSENVLVRSSITPWIITTRLNTSIFADSGMNNLESPRFIMGMNKNDSELASIVSEIKAFLKGRESIASITNKKDLENAAQIYQVNEQTRSHRKTEEEEPKKLSHDEQAAGFLRQNPPENDESKA